MADTNHKIGEHITYFENPDIIVMKLVGSVSEPEGAEINRRQREFARGRRHVFFLIDLEHLDKLPPGVRKESTETLRDLPLRGIAIYRAPFKAKVMAKMIITALNLFRGDASRHAVEFAESEEAAREWIAAQRNRVAAEAA